MDKYEYRIKLDEIKDLMRQGDYGQAAEIADTIDWRRVRSANTLCKISDLYKLNRRLEDSRDLLLLAREYRPTWKNICYALCELSIKLGEYVQAIEYYKEFVLLAPKDSGRYILQYKLYEAQDVSLEERIEVLEELKKHDYMKKWVYELAYLYHRVGLGTRCAEECDELIAMLGDGKYVIKAMELKMLHQPLSPEQQEKYDHRFDRRVENMPAEEAYAQENVYEQQNVQTYEPAAGQTYGAEAEALSEAKTIEFKPVRDDGQAEAGPAEPSADELDIQVKTVDVGEYNTVDLQKEIAQGLQEVLGAEQRDQALQDEVIQSLVAPMLEPDEEVLIDEPKETEAEPEVLKPVVEEIESSEVFFGETGNMAVLPEEPEPVEKQDASAVKTPDRTGEIVMQQMRQETFVDIMGAMAVEPPKEMAHVLAQEADGQISLVVPDSRNVEKQITGQMNIEDILAEWERVKQENVEKRKEDVRQHVLQQTGKMFSEFDAAVRDGLLEQLEQEEIDPAEEVVEMISEPEEASAENWEEQPESEELPAEAWEEQPEYEEAPAEDWEEQPESEELPAEAWEEQPEVEEAPAENWEEQPEVEEAPAEDWEEQPESDEVEELEEIEEESQPEGAEEPAEAEAPAEAEMSAEPEASEKAAPAEPEEKPADEPTEELTAEPAADQAESEEAPTEEIAAAEAETEVPAETDTEREEVVREKGKVRSMTKEEQELYAPFIQSKAAREQIVTAIDGISLAAYTGNVIITGEEGMDTMSLAKNMVKELQAMDSNFSGKIAKISGHALNKKNVNDVIQQLQNGALIVQKACDMDDKTVKALHKVLQQEDLGIVVLIEDNRKVMNSFLSEYEKLRNEFTVRVDVEALSNDTLVAYGKQYAQEMEYSIDELGVLALHTRIEEKQTIDHAVTTPEVKVMVDEAIGHANKKNIKHFFDILLFKRYDENDMIVLTERDFA